MGTRDQILDAAAHVMRTQGLAGATTKEIAREAGYSEATLYKHFQDKQELFLHVLDQRMPPLGAVITLVQGRAGTASVRGNLEALAAAAIDFYREAFPIAGSIFSDLRLLTAFRDGLSRRGVGPHVPLVKVADYLRAERELGRISADADPDAMASLLLGACFQQAFLAHFNTAPPITHSAETPAARLVRTLLAPLIPAAPEIPGAAGAAVEG